MLNNSLVGGVRGRDCRLRERPAPTACAAPTCGELPVEAEVRAAPTAQHRHGLLSRAGAARYVRHRVVHPMRPSSGQKAIGGEYCTATGPRAPDAARGHRLALREEPTYLSERRRPRCYPSRRQRCGALAAEPLLAADFRTA